MFGYIRPSENDLMVRDLKTYKAIYCSVCRASGQSFTWTSRLMLTYDSAFLAALTIGLKHGPSPIQTGGRCIINKLKKCSFCAGYSEEFRFVAAVGIILAHSKLVDNIRDSKNIFRKIFFYFLLIVLNLSYKKARKVYIKVDKIVKDEMVNQDIVEKNLDSTIDQSAYPTAQMFSSIFGMISKNESQIRILSKLGFFLGKWVYLVDAVDDLEEDFKRGNFNPLIIRFGENFKAARKYSGEVLNQILYQLLITYNLLEIKNLKGLLDNIVRLSLKQTQDSIVNKSYCKKRRLKFSFRFKKSEGTWRIIAKKGEN
ncbi:MAG: DUF5685 family protein [Oscillospiraceae bacterium]|jgi:hypothetical protein|nr:DUF5685 family protein [Oscillospiraceae bacterium]